MKGLNRNVETKDGNRFSGERMRNTMQTPTKHIASLATKEKDQVTGVNTTQPMSEMSLHLLEHYVLMSKKRLSSSQQEAGIQKSFRDFLPNKTGTGFSFPSSIDSNDLKFKTLTSDQAYFSLRGHSSKTEWWHTSVIPAPRIQK